MSETETPYTLTAKGNLTLELTDQLEALLREQRQEIASLLQESSFSLGRHDCFGAAEQIADALAILGLSIGPTA